MKIRKTPCITIFISAFLFLSCSGQELHAGDLTFPDNKGKIVSKGEDYVIRLMETPGKKVKTAEALFLVKADPETVFKVITDFDHYPEFMPNIVSAKLERQGKEEVVYAFILKAVFWNIGYTLTLKSRIENNVCSLTWDFMGGDIRDTTGSWEIRAYEKEEGYSLAFYRVRTDPGRFVPRWITDRLSARSIPDMIAAIRKRAGDDQWSAKSRMPNAE